jgi:ribosomal protein S18 acetylase RimI-like enzyme
MNADGIVVDGPFLGQAAVCEPILRALPEWFGIEEATAQYVRDIDALPTFLASMDGEAVGFLTIKRHNAFSAEIHVMGVHPAHHHRGVGRALVRATEDHLLGQGVEYLQVKTLSDAHPDEGYARTRAFYRAMGFRPLQELPKLWGAGNPCLQMIKGLHD